MKFSGILEPEIVRKIREAPNEIEARAVYQQAQELEFELERKPPSQRVLKSLLERLNIKERIKKQILLSGAKEGT